MALDSSCPSPRISSLSHSTTDVHRANFQSQEQSSGIFTLDGDEPAAIDELLKYLYTLSDHINVPVIKPCDGSHWNSKVKDVESFPDDIKYLARVLAVADEFCVSDLATLANETIHQ
jgi:hypothetical protein